MTTSAWPELTTSTKPRKAMRHDGVTKPFDGLEPQRSVASDNILQPQGWWALAFLAKRLVTYVVGLVVIFAIIEGALAWQKKNHPNARRFIPRYPTPYVEFYSEAMYDGDGVSTNDAGFRYGDLPLKKPEGETRIFMLSSSLGFYGNTNETTISGYMEAMLAESSLAAHGQVRVINAASLALVTRQSLVLLVTKVLDYEPDAIIIFHGPETLFYAIHEDPRLGYPYTFALRESQDQKLKQYLDHPNPFLATLSDMRSLQRFQPDLAKTLVHQKLATLKPREPVTAMQELVPHMEGVASDIGKMIHIAAKFGCRTMVAIPPWHARDLVKEALPALSDRVSAQCQNEPQTKAVFIDTGGWEEDLTDQQVWHPDGIHWKDTGNQIIAAKFVEALRECHFVE